MSPPSRDGAAALVEATALSLAEELNVVRKRRRR